MGGMVETDTAIATPDINARWRVCLHEAGHAAAGRHFFKRTTRAVVFSNASGVADTGGGGADVPTSFKGALVTAAGRAAERLVTAYPPPQVALPVPLEVAYPEPAAHLMADIPILMTDGVAVARWCIEGRETQPDVWAKRHDWVRDAAEDFVAEHQQEIVEAAMGLFARGILTLPAQAEETT